MDKAPARTARGSVHGNPDAHVLDGCAFYLTDHPCPAERCQRHERENCVCSLDASAGFGSAAVQAGTNLE